MISVRDQNNDSYFQEKLPSLLYPSMLCCNLLGKLTCTYPTASWSFCILVLVIRFCIGRKAVKWKPFCETVVHVAPVQIHFGVSLFSGHLVTCLGTDFHRGAGVLDVFYETPSTLLSCGYDTYIRYWDLRTSTRLEGLVWELNWFFWRDWKSLVAIFSRV